jgi:hypothetical protein
MEDHATYVLEDVKVTCNIILKDVIKFWEETKICLTWFWAAFL